MKTYLSRFAVLSFSLILGCDDDSISPSSTIDFEIVEEPDFGVNLLSLTPSPFSGGYISDVWGYTDSETNKEYAIVGHVNEIGSEHGGDVAIYEVRSDGSTTLTSRILNAEGFDVKTWKNFLFIANGGPQASPGNTSLIYDIQNLALPKRVGSVLPTHNFTVDTAGYLYLSGSIFGAGLTIMDLNEDPTDPRIIWQDTRSSSGHDVSIIGDRMYDFHETETIIYDLTNSRIPSQRGIVDDERIGYHHSGWATDNGEFLIIADEGLLAYNQTADFTIWDIVSLGQPKKVAEISDPTAIGHNIYMVGNLAYASYYTAGFKLFDLTDPLNPVLIGKYDTNKSRGGSYEGAFGVYPFTKSGHIYVTDTANGLYIFERIE